MYDNYETADCRKLSEAEFMEMMLKIEEQEIAARAANKKIKRMIVVNLARLNLWQQCSRLKSKNPRLERIIRKLKHLPRVRERSERKMVKVPKMEIVKDQNGFVRSARTLGGVKRLTLLMIRLIVKRLEKRDLRIIIIIKALITKGSNLRRRNGRKW
jgi:hypothetical protein